MSSALLPFVMLLSAPPLSAAEVAAPVPGLDHVIVAVCDLEAAAERYRALGFALKPGRPHADGIRNQHAKFPDGTEIELPSGTFTRTSFPWTRREISTASISGTKAKRPTGGAIPCGGSAPMARARRFSARARGS